MWEELQQEYEGRIEFLELDLDDRDDEAVARDHGIFYQPGFIIYSAAGDLVHNQPGPNSGDEMRRLVASALEEG
ncbi:MAG: hypothetical protein F4Z77_09370 [Dehalococcoidia bacterium]|nr:hypothetical protein [Dehalococcoidia bacterium]MYA53555.1 hypothetical protein [Dehalococcoidia bacterium]